MNKTLTLKKRVLILHSALSLICSISFSQLYVNNTTYKPTVQTQLTNLVQKYLLGPGVTVSNLTFSGDSAQIGYFLQKNSNIGLDSGLVMASGDVLNAIGPNNTSSETSSYWNFFSPPNGDSDLDSVSGNTTYDAAILEFDFIPNADTLRFEYVFGSEEYMEFAFGSVNDGFGFFISGPGITGNYSNNSKNIALVPNTTTEITINDLNLLSNSQYYFDNGDGQGFGTAPDGQTVQYDGFTVPLSAIVGVECGQTYHIKLAIADAGDDSYDSGVFLRAGSFSSAGGLTLATDANLADTICPNNDVQISATGSIPSTATIIWDFNGAASITGSGLGPYTLNWSEPGLKNISVSVQSGTGVCDSVTNTVQITIDECPVTPINVVTPNGDKLNDLLKFPNLLNYANSSIEVYNRWGNKVFENSNYKNDWNLNEVPDGTYYYILNVSNGQQLQGFFTVIGKK
ncbi:MAG: gliding motility-associated C-terminal domain-containing protein [Bacteroidetes bacterium]|nr:gliding motility-associated C-terminal domain-containing protein [Bacteroidota bacterium]